LPALCRSLDPTQRQHLARPGASRLNAGPADHAVEDPPRPRRPRATHLQTRRALV